MSIIVSFLLYVLIIVMKHFVKHQRNAEIKIKIAHIGLKLDSVLMHYINLTCNRVVY